MKIRKLLERAQELFDPAKREKKAKKKHLKQVIKKLRKHEKSLSKRLKAEPSKTKSGRISERIQLVHAQRKKGLGILKDLNRS
ncbi:MAG: hypothetical protein SynsKO_01050 [Synoicihabitans sp.]